MFHQRASSREALAGGSIILGKGGGQEGGETGLQEGMKWDSVRSQREARGGEQGRQLSCAG